ncbi:MAG: QueT transporter family protein [Clostridia bacterium]|nr:QueT transporter family protein [Clostridia bacterium]
MKKSTFYLVKSALIGAFYAVLTVVSTLIVPYLTFGPIQLRLSEALVVLPLFTPAAVPGLFVGCVISNAVGVALGANIAGVWDILIGSAATLLAALFTRWLRNIKFKGMPLLALLPPVIFNALIVGFELSFFLPELSYLIGFLQVGVSELIVVYALGLPLYFAIKKSGLDKRL